MSYFPPVSALGSRQNLPAWLNGVVWLAVFLSPTIYLLLLLLANSLQIPVPPAKILFALFFLIPVVALLICEWVVWSCGQTMGRKVGWMLCTLLAMLIQCGFIFAILQMILVATISYAQ